MIKTMIVEDEQPILNLMKILLLKIGHFEIVGAFNNPLEALAHIEDLQPELLFLDVQMPRMNGIELATALRSMPIPQPHLVFVTAYRQDDALTSPLAPLDFIWKPVTAEAIAHTYHLLLAARAHTSGS